MKKLICAAVCLCLALSGCRTRTTGQDAGESAGEAGERAGSSLPGSLIDDGADEDGDEDEAGGESGRTKENPEASRKEYDENAPAEIVPGAERTVHGEGEGGGIQKMLEDAGIRFTASGSEALMKPCSPEIEAPMQIVVSTAKGRAAARLRPPTARSPPSPS